MHEQHKEKCLHPSEIIDVVLYIRGRLPCLRNVLVEFLNVPTNKKNWLRAPECFLSVLPCQAASANYIRFAALSDATAVVSS